MEKAPEVMLTTPKLFQATKLGQASNSGCTVVVLNFVRWTVIGILAPIVICLMCGRQFISYQARVQTCVCAVCLS